MSSIARLHCCFHRQYTCCRRYRYREKAKLLSQHSVERERQVRIAKAPEWACTLAHVVSPRATPAEELMRAAMELPTYAVPSAS